MGKILSLCLTHPRINSSSHLSSIPKDILTHRCKDAWNIRFYTMCNYPLKLNMLGIHLNIVSIACLRQWDSWQGMWLYTPLVVSKINCCRECNWWRLNMWDNFMDIWCTKSFLGCNPKVDIQWHMCCSTKIIRQYRISKFQASLNKLHMEWYIWYMFDYKGTSMQGM